MKPKYPQIAFLMFKLDAEISDLNKTQNRITKLKDEILDLMDQNNLQRVCYDGLFSASVRGKQLLVRHNAGRVVEE